MRPISFSACFISSMARFSMALCSLSYCQLAHISEWTMYWLMAVSSSARNGLSTAMILSFPFMAASFLLPIINYLLRYSQVAPDSPP